MEQVVIKVKDGSIVKSIKTKLDQLGALDKSQKISKVGDEFLIPTKYTSIDQLSDFGVVDELQYELKKSLGNCGGGDSNGLNNVISKYLQDLNIPKDESEILLSKIPKKYTLYPPLLLINNQDTFDSIQWEQHFQKNSKSFFYKLILQKEFPNITHIAINKPIIEQDIMRRPFNIIPLYGNFGPQPTEKMFETPTQGDFNDAFWCGVVQNGIYQSWAPRYTMFSRGNIKEKARILKFPHVKDTTVVDMYAGIGYFTLSYLKLGAKVFCFEINPWSIQGLIRGVEKNGFNYKVIGKDEIVEYDPNVQCWIFNESNEFALKRLSETLQNFNISHINMGLLPSSRQSWNHSLDIIKQYSTTPTTIHIHENVSDERLNTFMRSTVEELHDLPLLKTNHCDHNTCIITPLHLEKIKTFAPGVWHICADFLVDNS